VKERPHQKKAPETKDEANQPKKPRRRAKKNPKPPKEQNHRKIAI
jgi:hypothetical protein